MALNISKTTIGGRLGRDPESKYSPSGMCVTKISVATTEIFKDKATGEKQEKTEWHNCVAFGKTAEMIRDGFKKGNQIYIEGHNTTRKWQDSQGNDKYTTEIKIDSFQFVDPKESSYSSAPRDDSAAPAAQPQSSQADGWPDDDDIPF